MMAATGTPLNRPHKTHRITSRLTLQTRVYPNRHLRLWYSLNEDLNFHCPVIVQGEVLPLLNLSNMGFPVSVISKPPEMYGPPRDCKGKPKGEEQVCANGFGL